MNAEIIIADKIVPLDELLTLVGHPFTEIPGSIRCPVHAGGQETRPSAKIYGKYDTLYCFACNRQYGASDIAASYWGLTREEAATKLLELWPPTEAQRQAILRDAKAEQQPTLDSLLESKLELTLKRYRGRVPLERYRTWAKALNEFRQNLTTFRKEYHQLTVHSFLERLVADLGDI